MWVTPPGKWAATAQGIPLTPPKQQQNITRTPGKGRDQGGGWTCTEQDLRDKGFFPFQERSDCEKVTPFIFLYRQLLAASTQLW